MSIRIPGNVKVADKICAFVFDNGPQTLVDIVAAFVARGHSDTNVRSNIRRMVKVEKLWLMHDKYVLSDNLIHLYAKSKYKGEIARPAEPAPFRPLNMKYIPSCRANRDDADEREPHTIYTSGTSKETLIRGAAL